MYQFRVRSSFTLTTPVRGSEIREMVMKLAERGIIDALIEIDDDERGRDIDRQSDNGREDVLLVVSESDSPGIDPTTLYTQLAVLYYTWPTEPYSDKKIIDAVQKFRDELKMLFDLAAGPKATFEDWGQTYEVNLTQLIECEGRVVLAHTGRYLRCVEWSTDTPPQPIRFRYEATLPIYGLQDEAKRRGLAIAYLARTLQEV